MWPEWESTLNATHLPVGSSADQYRIIVYLFNEIIADTARKPTLQGWEEARTLRATTHRQWQGRLPNFLNYQVDV
ncbi:MAG: hypothetical protein J07HQX50_01856 [Haloquadratum sp. J07HQX50]|nr:MAG: hypothetical protein J07HQX50_01856 [Haloquadratum sp. J07HQX50]